MYPPSNVSTSLSRPLIDLDRLGEEPEPEPAAGVVVLLLGIVVVGGGGGGGEMWWSSSSFASASASYDPPRLLGGEGNVDDDPAWVLVGPPLGGELLLVITADASSPALAGAVSESPGFVSASLE